MILILAEGALASETKLFLLFFTSKKKRICSSLCFIQRQPVRPGVLAHLPARIPSERWALYESKKLFAFF
jgi:hypothetical protein